MALAQKFSDTATTKTHGKVDADFIDLLKPNAELDSTGSLIRSVVYGCIGWVARGYKENRTFGF